MYQDQINTYFSHREQEFIDITSQLIAVPSARSEELPGMPYGKGPAEALAVGMSILQKIGFKTRNMENQVGTADLNEKETSLAILCHLDVVAEGSGWNTPPYTPIVRDGMLYGRGSSDNKGPAAAAIMAMQAVKEMKIPLRSNVRLILGTAEETGSSDIAYYMQHEKMPPCTFSPDGEFPVTNTEKGGLKPTFSKTWKESTVLPRIVSVHGGHTINIVPEQAEAVIEGLSVAETLPFLAKAQQSTGAEFTLAEENGKTRISAHGKPEHASTPEKGCNAITALLTLLAGMPVAESESFTAVKQLNQLFPHGDFYGKAAGIAQSDEISGPLTLSFDIFDQTLTGFTGRFDSRVPICATKENCHDVIEAKFNKLGIKMEGQQHPSHHTPCDSPFVQTLLAIYEKYTGNKGGCESMGGGTYVHDIEGGVAFGAMMPGFEPNMHGANEHVSIKDMITAAKIFTQVIIDICS
ncbi:MAG: Sapep family Mn(2+)-dependent dipeptidase [Chloroflexi bacterium]|nr:Sapep family Mn(2+)-dependent dipeptidase [Chloroflexota bacterium]